MRPFKGILVKRGTVRCENGVTYGNLNIPKGIKWYDPVLVYYDLTLGRVVSVEPDIHSEEVAELEHHEEVPRDTPIDGVEDDVIETDGSGLS